MDENNVRSIYEMRYDDPERQKEVKLLGQFCVIHQIYEDAYDELFIGADADNGELYLVKGDEVCGWNGGERYSVYPLKDFQKLDEKSMRAFGNVLAWVVGWVQ